MEKNKRVWSIAWLVVFLAILGFLSITVTAGNGTNPQQNFGILSLVPPLAVIILALLTEQVLLSFFIAIWLGGIIYANGNPISGFIKAMEWMVAGLGNSWNAGMFILTLGLAGVLAVTIKSGGAHGIAKALSKYATNRRRAMLLTYLFGWIIFVSDYINDIVVGSVMQPVAREKRISSEKLSYLVDTTASPVSAIAVISAWIGFMIGLINSAYNELGITQESAYMGFLYSIPFNLYCIIVLILTAYIVLSGRDWGPMLKAELRAIKEGKYTSDEASPLIPGGLFEILKPDEKTPKRAINFVVPILSLLLIIFVGAWFLGGGPEGATYVEALNKADWNILLMCASFGPAVIAFILYYVQKIMGIKEFMNAYIEGIKQGLLGPLILVMAWSLGNATKALGTANFVVSIAQNVVSPYAVPLIIFTVACVMSFITGTSWGTFAVLTPIAVPLAYYTAVASNAPVMEIIHATIGAIFAGGVFGDHTGIQSDTTIMSAMFSGADVVDHFKTQLPYALLAAIGAFIGYVITVYLSTSPILGIAIGAIVAIGLHYILSERDARRLNIKFPLEVEA